MPLQKPPPHGPQHLDGYAAQRSPQERRRTLQTISELSVIDNVPREFNALTQPSHNRRWSYTKSLTVEKKPRSPNKRRSLPQYCSSPECLRAQASNAATPLHPSRSSSSLSPKQSVITANTDVVQHGWNARRERARIQHEQAIAGANSPPQISLQNGWIGSEPFVPKQSPPFRRSSQQHLKSHTSHPYSLRNSRSASGYTQTVERRASFGTPGSAICRDFDTESAGRVSTDSSSHRSSHGNASRRSHSSPSQSPVALPAPIMPLPKAIVPRRPRYYSNPANMQNGLVLAHLGPAQSARPKPNTRSLSMPTIRVEHIGSTNQHSRQNGLSPPHCSTNKERDLSIQKARLATLAALTASPPSSHDTNTAHPSHRASHHHRTRSASSLRSPLPTYTITANSSWTNIHGQHLEAHRHVYEHAALETRAVPKRESLTQWKAEREEAKIEFGSLRRAEMKERVRRANELEMEREKELLLLGKGTGTSVSTEVEGEVKRKERGCFGGVWKVFGWGW